MKAHEIVLFFAKPGSEGMKINVVYNRIVCCHELTETLTAPFTIMAQLKPIESEGLKY